MTRIGCSFLCLLPFLLLAACGNFSSRPDPTRFFTLSSLQDAKEPPKPGNADLIVLGIGPVRLPGYLDRQEIVTRNADNRFRVSENDRWAEPLDENFTRVLSQNLAVILPADRVMQYPWPSSKKPQYQLEIEVLRFEVNNAHDAQLWARWELTEASSKTLVIVKESRLTRQAKDGTTDAAVAALSEAGADLCREIAATIRDRSPDKALMSGRSSGP